jgi:hypothetical protein
MFLENHSISRQFFQPKLAKYLQTISGFVGLFHKYMSCCVMKQKDVEK